MRSLFTLLCALVCTGMMIGAASAGSFSPRLIDDAYVDAEEEDENFGLEDELWVSSEEGEPAMITYLYFLKIGSKSEDEIESATLSLYATDVDNPGEVSIHFSEEGFSQDTVTWSDELEYDETADHTVEISEEGWYDFDATEIVKKAIERCPSCPFSVFIVAEDDASIAFASQEGSEDDKPVLKYTSYEG